jgi:hypothetical protein
MDGEERVATVGERLAGRLRLDGQLVTDLDTPYPETSRVTIGGT